MRRYSFLTKADNYEALNRLRDAFLAAKDGNEVNQIINGLLTEDEKIRIGRRIIISQALNANNTYQEIISVSNVGRTTVNWVARQMVLFPICFKLLLKRYYIVQKKYEHKRMREVTLSPLPDRRREYSGIKRSDIKR